MQDYGGVKLGWEYSTVLEHLLTILSTTKGEETQGVILHISSRHRERVLYFLPSSKGVFQRIMPRRIQQDTQNRWAQNEVTSRTPHVLLPWTSVVFFSPKVTIKNDIIAHLQKNMLSKHWGLWLVKSYWSMLCYQYQKHFYKLRSSQMREEV